MTDDPTDKGRCSGCGKVHRSQLVALALTLKGWRATDEWPKRKTKIFHQKKGRKNTRTVKVEAELPTVIMRGSSIEDVYTT